MARYLLDTNIVSDLIKQPLGRAARRLRERGEDNVITSVVVLSELHYGLAKRGSARLARQTGAVLDSLEALPLEAPSAVVYGDLRATLEHGGLSIGANDLLIAAHALALGCVLVTDNEREFRRVPGLAVENWLRDYGPPRQNVVAPPRHRR